MRVMKSKTLFESFQENLKEEINNASKDAKLIFDSEDERFLDDSPESELDFDAEYEDVTSLIDDQINDYLILNGYNKTWNKSGSGYMVKKDLKGIIGNYDVLRVYENSDGGIDLGLYDHDGGTDGTLYTFKKDSIDDIEELLQEYFFNEDFSMYYFLDWVDAGAIKAIADAGYLVPLSANGVLSESALEPKYDSAKSFYGKANVDNEGDSKVLTSYDTKIMKIKDGKITMLCDESDLSKTTLRHIREFLKQEGIEPLSKSELVKLINNKDLKESDEEFESYEDFSDGDIIKDVIDNYKKITGEDIKEVFNYDKEKEGFFNQETIDRTGSKIIEYWKEKGLDRDRIDDLLYALDDELQSRWSSYVNESVDEETGKEILLGNDESSESGVETSENNDDKLDEHDSVFKVYKPTDTERDYSIVDITELGEITEGDVQPPIDVAGLLTEVDSRLTESFGNWGTINIQSTRCNKDTNESNALFELNVGDNTYLLSMLLENNCSTLKVNNTNGKTIFKRKSKDIIGLAESYIKQFIPKEADEVPECLKHINEPLHAKLAFIRSYIDMIKLAPKEEKESFKAYIEKEIYAFIAEVSDEIKANEPNNEDKLELPSFDKMVEEIFGKEWVKENKEEPKEIEGAETLKESFFVKIWNDATEDYEDFEEYENEEDAKKSVAELKKNGEKVIIEKFSEKSRDPELSGEVDYYNKTFNEAEEINPAEEVDENPKDEPKNGLGTGYATFVRKPSNIEDLDNKAKYFTDGDASYLIVEQQNLSKDEFDKLQEDFSKSNKYCKSFEPLDTDNYSYNVIEFICSDYDYRLLVDPSGFDYCRYVAKV